MIPEEKAKKQEASLALAHDALVLAESLLDDMAPPYKIEWRGDRTVAERIHAAREAAKAALDAMEDVHDG